MILLVGSEGSMGKRYQSILKHLGQNYIGMDKPSTNHEIYLKAKASSGIIIATPTVTHCDFLCMFALLEKPILCEKPLATSNFQLNVIESLVKGNNLDLTMMFQYDFLPKNNSRGPSYYNYFRHGNDGLYWDCLQIIGLAKDEILVEETSPIWKCQINGMPLSLSDMDQAYVDAVKSWIEGKRQDMDQIFKIHQKVSKFKVANGD